ncbi:IS110 family transposase [Leisingera methylohalidivorans]|uniref:Transposase IS110-like N-terminal domain-containing protein n=1 Tax=Leisingera methylohalidivorans DSM 14336 TaxID=999552 RepID=V9W055_9RHOB|nr:IS110 family transposase [Leisingera methylohalidivorans]AHD03563.1 hypothetical protein METH_22300 [Leisingera methylohalidivorans DSM 14336]
MTRVLFAGLDVSLELTSICVVDADGSLVLEAKAVSDPADISEVLVNIGGTFERVGFEAGSLSQWLYNGLIGAGLPAVCMEARHAKAAMVAMNRNKNVRNDARSLAQLTRLGWFKSVHVKSTESQEMRTLLMSREFFVNKLRDHENEIRGLLRPFGLKVGRLFAHGFGKGPVRDGDEAKAVRVPGAVFARDHASPPFSMVRLTFDRQHAAPPTTGRPRTEA